MQSEQRVDVIKVALSAFTASLISQIVHPLDVIKTRLQSHDGRVDRNLVPKYNGVWHASKMIYRTEGLRGLTKGLFVSLFANSFANTCFFVIYEHSKQALKPHTDQYVFVSSVYASALSTMITQPIWVVKTRVLLNTDTNVTGYRNTQNAFCEIRSQHGFKGFYRGTTMSLVLCIHGIVQMNFYELFMQHLELGPVKPFISGMLSKVCAIYVTYPLNTIRTRIQQNQFIGSQSPKYSSIYDVLLKTAQLEGMSGFYKGVVASTFRGLPSKGFFFFFYELWKGN